MEENSYVYSKLEEMTVSMQSQPEKNLRLLRGKAFLDENSKSFTFVQYEQRNKRSVEVCRSTHGRLVKKPSGDFTLTFRFDEDTRDIKETLISEIRTIVKSLQAFTK